ncbi:MAG: T9SS type A sorting domain-containing protein, partial [Bacteroidales bacterium]|nr:T9SS type A sorting domain-containing protein [Bacteroidales bacterium]
IYLIIPKLFIQGNGNTPELELTGYPNPFSENVTLNYNLPETGKVNLKVYNVLGELVNELVNQEQTAGKYTIEFPGKDLPAGMYSFKLDFINQKEIISAILKLIK